MNTQEALKRAGRWLESFRSHQYMACGEDDYAALAVLKSAVEERDTLRSDRDDWKTLCEINQDLVKQAIKNIDALKAEVERLRGEWDLRHGLYEHWKARAKKAEAEVERLRRQVEIEQRKVSDLDGLLAKYHEAAEQAEAELAAARPIIEVAKELLETADLRGDSVLPLPPDDPKPWSAHAQTVWNALRAALAHKEAKDKP